MPSGLWKNQFINLDHSFGNQRAWGRCQENNSKLSLCLNKYIQVCPVFSEDNPTSAVQSKAPGRLSGSVQDPPAPPPCCPPQFSSPEGHAALDRCPVDGRAETPSPRPWPAPYRWLQGAQRSSRLKDIQWATDCELHGSDPQFIVFAFVLVSPPLFPLIFIDSSPAYRWGLHSVLVAGRRPDGR